MHGPTNPKKIVRDRDIKSYRI